MPKSPQRQKRPALATLFVRVPWIGAARLRRPSVVVVEPAQHQDCGPVAPESVFREPTDPIFNTSRRNDLSGDARLSGSADPTATMLADREQSARTLGASHGSSTNEQETLLIRSAGFLTTMARAGPSACVE